jgi:hypothetical protein
MFLSQAVNFKTHIQPKRPTLFSNALQKALIGKWVKITADIEYPFERGEVINYTLDGLSIHPVTTGSLYRIKYSKTCILFATRH